MMLNHIRAAAIFLTALSSGAAFAQTNQGLWEPPFNHPLSAGWFAGQPNWDGEPASPYVPPPADRNRFMAGHMSLIPVGRERGKVLVWNWMRVPYGTPVGLQHWAIVDVSTPTPTFQNFDLPIATSDGDLFCSGHAWSKDGHLLVAGGNRYNGAQLQANRLAFRFDPTVQPTGNAMWVREPDLKLERWYPTVTALSTDATGLDLMAVTGGFDFFSFAGVTSYEVFDPSGAPGGGAWQIDPVGGTQIFPGPPGLACDEIFAIYPRQHVLSSGRLFFSGSTERGFRLDQTQVSSGSPATWDVHAANPFPGWHRDYSSNFLFPNMGGPLGGFSDIVVKVGGAPQPWVNCLPSQIATPTNSTEFCFADLAVNDPNWVWNTNGPSMQFGRFHHNAVLLPDATVVAVGGNLDTNGELNCALPVLQTELLNDLPFAWRTLAPATVRRGYHSTAVLLPDGRVLVGGGEQREFDYEVFQPHYLTNGTTRPQILNAPATLDIKYGRTYDIEYAAGVTVERAVLMAPGSVTHHSDMHQRYFELQTITPPPPGPNPIFSFQAPTSAGQAPRGYYMLFLISSVQPGANRGTPSVATWVYLQ